MKKIKQDNVEDRRIRGMPGDHLETSAAEESIERIDKQIEMTHKQTELLKKQTDVMIKYPKPLDPKFAYEESEEWIEIAREHHKMGLEYKLIEKEIEIKGLEDQKKNFEIMLEDRKDGILEEKKEE